MTLPTLESLTADLDEKTVGLLGDPISYQVGAGPAITLNAWADHKDKTDAFAGVQVTAQDIIVEVRKSDVPVVSKSDVIGLPHTGKSYRPREWMNDRSGRWWIILLAVER